VYYWSVAAPLPSTGELFAERYRVVAKLAAGGMGAVFEAEDERSGNAVAVKLLHPELAQEPEMHRRFKREGSILQALHHPSVVRVRDVGTDARGRSYTVMELLRGETLHARIEREGALDLGALGPIVEGIAAGLGAAHEHGVLHGDLKPANVFLLAGEDGAVGGAVKLVDFGTSKVHGLERLTRTGEVIGTPTYMAPELLTGDGTIDERIDVYAFGVLLYQSLAGVAPFTERNPGKLLFQIVMGQGVPLEERRPGLPASLYEVVRHAMAPKKADRFESPRAVANAWASTLPSAEQ